MNTVDASKIGRILYNSLRNAQTIPPLTETISNISIDDAYEISKSFLSLRLADGEKIIGKKIGVTSQVVQEMLGVDQPDFGFLTNQMLIENVIFLAVICV